MADVQLKPGELPEGEGYPDGPVPYTLKRPVRFTIPGKSEAEVVRVEKVEVREPTGDDIIAMGAGKTQEEKAARLVSSMCGQPSLFGRKVSGWDFAQIAQIVARFFPKGASPLEGSPPES